MKILIVEDDSFIRELLKKELEKWDYEVNIVTEFSEVISIFQKEHPDLVLMDIKLPVYDGYYFTRKIRENSDVPIIFISSMSDNMNQIMAMEMGADDFIVKPFEINFVLSKIKAMIRRTYTYSQNEEQDSEKFIHDHSKLELIYKEKSVTLTRTENVIMDLLFSKKNKFVSRNELIDACWQGDDYIDDNTLFVNISRLRKKLSALGLENVIETKKNVGYRFNEETI